MLRILVPTDYSPEAKHAMLYAFHFARYTNSALVLYHAMPAVIPVTDIPYENYYLDETEEQFLLLDHYRQLLRQHRLDPEEVPAEARVELHNVVSTGIADTCKTLDCDLIIMGTHGASGWRKIIWGSNTARVINETEVPVIAIPGEYRFEPVYHMVYASDLLNLEEELGVLVPFAKVFDAALELVFFDYAGPESETLMLNAEATMKSHGYDNLRLTIRKGDIQLTLAENLRKTVDASSTQMLILFQGEHGWMDQFFNGSNSARMVLHPGLPVMVFHKSKKE